MSDSENHCRAARARYNHDDYPGAIAFCDLAILADPRSAGAYNTRAAARYQLGDFAGSLADSSFALVIDPTLTAAYINRAAARNAVNDATGAIADCDQALRINPQLFDAYLNRGIARYQRDDFRGAVADYDQALTLDPQSAAGYAARAAAWNAIGDFVRALVDADRALAINPQFCPAYIARANARYHRGLPSATLDYRQAFTINPELSARLMIDGLATMARRVPCVALVQCDRYLQRNPRDAIHYARRGLLLLLRGRDADAKQDFDKYLQLRPEGEKNLILMVAEARRRSGAK